MTYWLSDWLADWLAEWRTVWMTNWLNDWLADWLSGWLTGWLTDWLNDWLTDWLNSWLTGWLADWQTEWLTDWLNEWQINRKTIILLDKLPVVQPVTKFLAFLGKWKFIPCYKNARHSPLPWARWFKPTPFCNTLYDPLNIIFPSTSSTSKWPPHSAVPSTPCTHFLHQKPAAACPVHLVLLQLTNLATFSEPHTPYSSSIFSFATHLLSSLLNPNILLDTPLSKIPFSLFPKERDQIS